MSEKGATLQREEELLLNSKGKVKNNRSGMAGDMQQTRQKQVEGQGPGQKGQTSWGQNQGLKDARSDSSTREENGRATAMRHIEEQRATAWMS